MQQPEELEEAVGDARLVKSRDEEDMSVRGVFRAHHSFCFSTPKRDRKLSDEEQQEEAKRPKSPEREGACSWRSSTATEARVVRRWR